MSPGRTDSMLSRVLATRPRCELEAVYRDRVDNSLQTAVVGMGVAIFWFIGTRAVLVR